MSHPHEFLRAAALTIDGDLVWEALGTVIDPETSRSWESWASSTKCANRNTVP